MIGHKMGSSSAGGYTKIEASITDKIREIAFV